MLQASSAYRRQITSTGSIAARTFATAATDGKKEKVVVLGTGWGAVHFFTALDKSKNYFTFTPLLPAVCAGTLSVNAVMEPIRNFTHKKGKREIEFLEATATDVDYKSKKVVCRYTDAYTGQKDAAAMTKDFTVEYDKLIVAVGAESNTFGVPGVYENAYFLKEAEHARDLRKDLLNRFERASIPGTSDAERAKLLSFVVVGGGPTGVETAAEWADFIHEDISKQFPTLIKHVKITLVERGNKLLGMFSPEISRTTFETFQRLGIRTLLEHAVIGITEDKVKIQNFSASAASNPTSELDYGLVLWASGVGQVPIAKHLINSIEGQKGNRVLTVNEQLKVYGAPNVYALGDCSWIRPTPIAEQADALFFDYTLRANGRTPLAFLKDKKKQLATQYPQMYSWSFPADADTLLTANVDGFKAYLAKVDGAFRSPAPTAQNARQEAWKLAANFNKGVEQPFIEKWAGSLAYVGGDVACMHLPTWPHNMIGGIHTLLAWKAIYIDMHISWRNKFICAFDWLKTRLAGRDLGRDHMNVTRAKSPFEKK